MPKSVPVTSAVLVIFIFMCGFQEFIHFALMLFALLNIMMIWMVYSVLTYKYVSPYTFQQKFYGDMDIKNNEPEENDPSVTG